MSKAKWSRKTKNIVFFKVLPIITAIIPIVAMVYCFWIKSFSYKSIVPVVIIFGLSTSILYLNKKIIDLLTEAERKVTNDDKLDNDHKIYSWYDPTIISARFRNVEGIVIKYSLCCASAIYLIGISINNLVVFVFHFFDKKQNNGITKSTFDNYFTENHVDLSNSDMFINFLFGEGFLIALFVLFLTIYTLVNTLLIKSRNEQAIETKDELFLELKEKFDIKNEKLNWENCSNRFVYIYDYSIALGAVTDENFFQYFHEIFGKFISSNGKVKDDDDFHKNRVVFQAIVNKPDRNKELYKKNYQKFKDNDKEIKNHLYWAHDLYITYLNKEIARYWNNNPEVVDKNKKEDYKKKNSIYFAKTYFDENIYEYQGPLLNHDIFHDVERLIGDYGYYRRDRDKLFEDITIDNISEKNVVFFDENVGLVRFIVTNKFVIQFVVGKKSANGNKKKQTATGFLSEDIILIERFKNAFEEYRNQMIEKQSLDSAKE
jgi:hypothetical protein